MVGDEMNAQQEPPVTEPVPAPEIFSEGYSCVGLGNGLAKFSFFSVTHIGEGQPPERRTVLRLTMPLGGVIGVHQALGNLIDSLKANGLIQDVPPAVQPQVN